MFFLFFLIFSHFLLTKQLLSEVSNSAKCHLCGLALLLLFLIIVVGHPAVEAWAPAL